MRWNALRIFRSRTWSVEVRVKARHRTSISVGRRSLEGQVRTLLDNLTVDALAVGRTAGRTRSA